MAYAASLFAGAAQVGRIVVQWAVMQTDFILQPAMLVAGSVVVLLDLLEHRGQSIFAERHSRPSGS